MPNGGGHIWMYHSVTRLKTGENWQVSDSRLAFPCWSVSTKFTRTQLPWNCSSYVILGWNWEMEIKYYLEDKYCIHILMDGINLVSNRSYAKRWRLVIFLKLRGKSSVWSIPSGHGIALQSHADAGTSTSWGWASASVHRGFPDDLGATDNWRGTEKWLTQEEKLDTLFNAVSVQRPHRGHMYQEQAWNHSKSLDGDGR